MSVFSTWLRAEMAQRGLDNRQLAQLIQTGDSTVHGWLEQDVTPNMRSLVLISRMFDVPTETVISYAGYDIVPSTDAGDRETRRAELLARLPRYTDIAEKLARLPPEKQDAYLTIIERLLPTD